MVILKSDSISELDFTKILNICNQLEAGLKLKAADLTVKMFAHISINSIYHVKLHPVTPLPPTIPKSLVIKLFTSKYHHLPHDLTTSQLTNLLLGQTGLGPSVFLITTEALVMQFLPGRIVNLYDDQQSHFRRAISTKLAQLHSLTSLPIERNQQKVYLEQIFTSWLSPSILNSLESGQMRTILQEFGCKCLVNVEAFKDEIEYIERLLLDDDQHGIVLCHNDFNHSNILVMEDEEEEDPADPEIRLVDFDFSRYFYRGADFGRYFLDYRDPAIEDTESSPDASTITEDTMLEYIKYYREECARLQGPSYLENDLNSVENLLREAKIFMLFASLINIVHATWVASFDDEETRDGCLIWADMCFGRYLRLKAKYQDEGTVL